MAGGRDMTFIILFEDNPGADPIIRKTIWPRI